MNLKHYINRSLLFLGVSQFLAGSLSGIEFQMNDCFEQRQPVGIPVEEYYEQPQEWCYSCPHNRFAFQAELLYLKPTVDQPFFVITSTDNSVGDEHFPSGKRHNIQTTYKPGFRLEGLYEFCSGIDFDARFTYFNSSHSKSVSGEHLFDAIGFPGEGAQDPEDTFYDGTATLHEKFRYYAGDATLNRLTFGCLPDNLTFLIGLHFAYIQRKEHFTGVGTFDAGATAVNNLLRRNSIFWGIGPEIGVDYRYRFTNCFSCLPGTFALFGDARGALLASHTEASLHYTSRRTAGTEGVNLSNEEVWRVTPSVDARLGLSYDFCVCSWNGTLEFGYEWIFYSDSIDMITGYDVAFPGDTIDLYSNFNLQGPFVALRFDF